MRESKNGGDGKREAGVREEQLVFWRGVGDVTSAFNLSITVMGLGAYN